jgi:hypothetical protein
MEQEFELMKVDVFGTHCVLAQVGPHKNTETVLADN